MVELPVEAAAGPAVGERHVVRGCVMVLAAATLWGINGAVIKVILTSGLSTYTVPELRSASAALGFGLALAGLALVVEIWRVFVLDALGVAAALGSATGYVIYVLSAEHELRRRDTLS